MPALFKRRIEIIQSAGCYAQAQATEDLTLREARLELVWDVLVPGRHGGFDNICEGEKMGLLAYFFQITLVFDQPSPVLWPLHN